MNIQGLQLIENRYMYIMFNKVYQPLLDTKDVDPKRKANIALLRSGNGAGFIDLETLKTNIKARCPLIPICGAVVGCNNQIIFSEINQKIVILQGFGRLKIIPLLHQNLLQLRNMKPRDQYLYAV